MESEMCGESTGVVLNYINNHEADHLDLNPPIHIYSTYHQGETADAMIFAIPG